MEQGLGSYDATRVPGYPYFIGLLGREETAVWVGQLALGVLLSLMLFYIGYRLTESSLFGFLLGVLYNFTASLVLFEFNLLSETLTTFLLVLSVAIFALLRHRRLDVTSYILALVLGVVASLAGLTRTMFIFLPVILLPFVMFVGTNWRQRVLLGTVFSIGPLVLLGGWIYFVYSHYDMLSPTTMGGYHLVQHTGAFFEELPESESTIRDIYLRYRDEQIAERGSQTNAIWDAIPALTEATGLSFFALSGKLQELSWQLIKENPLLYLQSVVDGWIDFWKAPVYWKPDQFSSAAAIVQGWSLLGRGISLLANGLFLILSSVALVSRRLRKRLEPPPLVFMPTVLIFFSSVLQTLVDHGDNPRFLIPLQMLVIALVAWALWKLSPAKSRS
ncbi:MAG: hypothetical protein ACLFWD_10585, partial [Anaerolineales bacterium]